MALPRRPSFDLYLNAALRIRHVVPMKALIRQKRLWRREFLFSFLLFSITNIVCCTFPRAIFCDVKNILHISEAPRTSASDGESTYFVLAAISWFPSLSCALYKCVYVCGGVLQCQQFPRVCFWHARAIFSHFLSILEYYISNMFW